MQYDLADDLDLTDDRADDLAVEMTDKDRFDLSPARRKRHRGATRKKVRPQRRRARRLPDRSPETPNLTATPEPDEIELWDRQTVLQFFGGSKPIHVSTLYRGVNSGIYPPPMNVSPNVVRWIGHECRAARQRMIGERGKTPKPPRGRPRRQIIT